MKRFPPPGLLWHLTEENDFRFVSSDGHRLAYYEVPTTAFPGFEMANEVIVPRKAVQEIHRLLEKETEASMEWMKNRWCFELPAHS